jgi:hypothetical protein
LGSYEVTIKNPYTNLEYGFQIKGTIDNTDVYHDILAIIKRTFKQFHQYNKKTNNRIFTELIEHKERPRHMTLEILVFG